MTKGRPLSLLVSSVSARGRALEVGHRVADTLRGGGWRVKVIVTTWVDDIADVSLEAGGAYLGVVGGDGYIAKALSKRTFEDPPAIPFPSGRGNDLCRSLDLGTDPQRIARVLADADGKTVHRWVRPLDVMKIGDEEGVRNAIGIVSLGIDATANRIANESSIPFGSLAYVWGAVSGFLGRFKPSSIQAYVDGELQDIGGWLTAVSNTGWFGGGVNVSPTSRTDDGLLEVLSVPDLPRLRVLPVLANALLARGTSDPLIRLERAKRVEFLSPKGMPAYADGDVIGHLPLAVSVDPSALRVVVPPLKAA